MQTCEVRWIGGDGGRPDMAQAGGKNPAGLTNALQLAKDVIKSY